MQEGSPADPQKNTRRFFMNDKKQMAQLVIAGALIGVLAVLSVIKGNPGNMGICIACFIRDIAGGLGLHRAEVVQYIRPEILGIILGAFGVSLFRKEFAPRVGSSPMLRFVIAFFMMIGALVFLGCPTRMILRLANGDLNALFGLAGFACGVGVGIFFLNKGYSLKRAYKSSAAEGSLISLIQLVLLFLLLSGSGLLIFSAEGPGSMHTPIFWALGVGLAVGVCAQITRMCTAGSIRDIIMFRDFTLFSGIFATFVAALILNLVLGKFNLGFEGQPVAHTDGLWNFLGMTLVGFGAILLGGCPLRQLILAGEGNIDSALTVIGLALGAAFAHNFKLASSPKGPTPGGQAAVIIGLILFAFIAFMHCRKESGFIKK
ncbi:MAG: YedE family putative selenium transporter [Peptostreptococcaceae bacterium]|nr:YedE family putative selenium transporter [Peptostreptococcaceae bacterium]